MNDKRTKLLLAVGMFVAGVSIALFGNTLYPGLAFVLGVPFFIPATFIAKDRQFSINASIQHLAESFAVSCGIFLFCWFLGIELAIVGFVMPGTPFDAVVLGLLIYTNHRIWYPEQKHILKVWLGKSLSKDQGRIVPKRDTILGSMVATGIVTIVGIIVSVSCVVILVTANDKSNTTLQRPVSIGHDSFTHSPIMAPSKTTSKKNPFDAFDDPPPRDTAIRGH